MIIPIEEKHLSECLTVIHAAYESVAEQFGITDENTPNRGHASLPIEELEMQFQRGRFMYGYSVQNRIVGFISFTKSSEHGKDCVKINDIVVLPEHQHNGIGTAMLDFAKDQALAFGIKKVTLGMIDDNTVLKEWYIKNGFNQFMAIQYDGAPFLAGYMEWNNGVAIRQTTVSDVATMLKIYTPFIKDTAFSFETEVPTLESFTERTEKLMDEYPHLVCEKDGVVIGYAYASKHRERSAYKYSTDVSIYIDPAFHRQGFGRMLYMRLFDLLRTQGVFTAYAGVTQPNDASIGLHKALGFTEVGTYHNVGYKTVNGKMFHG